MVKRNLQEYEKRRDFSKTPEPAGAQAKAEGNSFVIQKHAARRLHYDFRLEVEGVLKSWAVPKGPSSSSSEKRLAVQTEDHPLDYKYFEGNIPEGQYGGGQVIIWDMGIYKNAAKNKNKQPVPIKTAIEEGKVEIFLFGVKTKGLYALVKMKNTEKDWLLIKKKDKYVNSLPDDLEEIGKSVVSGEEIVDSK